jgi:hypothetical protein
VIKYIEDMKVVQAYSEYMVPTNLREHMLRVTALGKIITTNWTGAEIDQQAIIEACLGHDIPKPMNFDLTKQAEYGMPLEEIDNLEKLQKRLKSRYGEDEHEAAVKVCEEIGCSQKVVKVVSKLEWSYVPELMKQNDLEPMITVYCDMRIGPKGILLLEQRLADLKSRTNTSEHEKNVKNGKLLEKLIKENCRVNLDMVTNEQTNGFFDELLNFEL